MSYTEAQVTAANAAIDKFRSGKDGEVGAALAVVGLSAERAARESAIRYDMIRRRRRPTPTKRANNPIATAGSTNAVATTT